MDRFFSAGTMTLECNEGLIQYMLKDMTSACARMEADVEAAFDVFGTAASEPSQLTDQLAESSGLGKGRPGSEAEWAVRAARMIATINGGDQQAVDQCATWAFDDADPRVRGLAWCVLAEMEDIPGMQERVKDAIVRAYVDRVASPRDPTLRRDEATGFAIILGATTAGESVGHFVKEAERDYISSNGKSDAWLIASSPAAALPFLTHSDVGRRLAAVRVVGRACNNDQRARDAIHERMTSDPEPEVRLAAIVTYGDLHSGTRAGQCLRKLAELVLDESQPLYHRFAAYCSLLTVDGRPLNKDWRRSTAYEERMTRLRGGALDAEWPIDPDWAFVRRCAQAR